MGIDLWQYWDGEFKSDGIFKIEPKAGSSMAISEIYCPVMKAG
jgi:hypothetical protein